MKILVATALLAVVPCLIAGDKDGGKARFTRDSELVAPSNYREWVFLSSGLGMTYGPNAPSAGTPQRFDNVFVNPAAYREFMRSGQWPDGTVLILEVRNSTGEGSINRHGRFQTNVAGIEAHVKDSKRFKGGWAFFNLAPGKTTSKAMAAGNSCEQCHVAHGAVDTTFVQFYPDLIPVAQKYGRMPASAAGSTSTAAARP